MSAGFRPMQCSGWSDQPAAAPFLNAGGRIIVEHGTAQRAAVQAIARENGFRSLAGITDYAGHDRIALFAR